MKNYYAYSPALFDVSEEELKKLYPRELALKSEYNKLLGEISAKYFPTSTHVMAIRTFYIPDHMKRTPHDNAILLVLTLSSGAIKAKRHQNSQWLKV